MAYNRSSERLKNLQNDVEAIQKACAADKSCPFKELAYKDFVFSFEYHCRNERRFYWVNLNEDYPDSSVLTWTTNGGDNHDMKCFDKPLPFIFSGIARELYKEMVIPVFPLHTSSASNKPAQPVKNSSDTEDDYGDDITDADEDECAEGDACYISDESMPCAHEHLMRDFESLKRFCEDAKLQVIPSLDEAHIIMSISTAFLENELARAWKLMPSEPIFIEIHFSYSQYIDDLGSTRVLVYQESLKRSLKKRVVQGVLIQLQIIVQNFIKKQMANGSGYASHNSTDPNKVGQTDTTVKNVANTFRTKPPSSSKSKSSSSLSRDHGNGSVLSSDPQHGILVQILSYVNERLVTLNDHCVICDEIHSFTSAAMLKPMVCDRQLCVFSYQTLGVMSNVADDIVVESEVIDLLIAMAKAACKSHRKKLIFDPYPVIVNPHKPTELAFSTEKKDYSHSQKIMDKIPPMEKMVNQNGVEVKKQLDKEDMLIFPFLQWIILSNRSHIVKMKPDRQLDFMGTPHQFLLRSSAPAKEAKFKEAKLQHGSVFAFHGSPIENWHSILRKGLINASGSSMQINGAAYGNGIYLSPEASFSYGYSVGAQFRRATVNVSQNKQGQNSASPAESSSFLTSSNIICIALCEVVNSSSLKRHTDGIWVMSDENGVVTRFLFVYENANQGNLKFRSNNPEILQKIKEAIQS